MGSGRANMLKLMPSPNPRISRITCSADGCDMKSGTNAFSEIKMFFFPSNPIRRRLWELAAREENWKSHKNSRICCKHFITGAPSKDPDHPDYVPSIFTFNKNTQKSKNLNRKTHRKLVPDAQTISQTVSSACSKSLEPINNALTQMMLKLADMEKDREQIRHELALCRGEIDRLRQAHQNCVANAPSTSTHSVPIRSSALPSTSEDVAEMLELLYSDEQGEVCDSEILPSKYWEQTYHQPNEASKSKRQTVKKKSKEWNIRMK